MPFSSYHHMLESLFLLAIFFVRVMMRMNIDLKLMNRMVHSVFGVFWSVYNE